MVRDGFKPGDLSPIIVKKIPNKFNKKRLLITAVVIILLFLAWILFKKPSVTLIGDKVEKVSYKSEFIDSGIKVHYHGKDVTNTVVTSNNRNNN